MSNIEMKTLTVGSNIYELVDGKARETKLDKDLTFGSTTVHRFRRTNAGGWGSWGQVTDIYHQKLMLIIYDNNNSDYHYCCVDIAFPNYIHHGNGDEEYQEANPYMTAHSTCSRCGEYTVWVEAQINRETGALGDIALNVDSGWDCSLEDWYYL